MGQFLDYLASVFSAKQTVEGQSKGKPSNHVTFADGISFTSHFTAKTDNEKNNKIALLDQSNKKIIYIYMALGSLACVAHFSIVVANKIKFHSTRLFESESWEHLILGLIPVATYIAFISALLEINKPVSSCARLTLKNAGLDFRNNQFVQSLRLVNLVMIMIQLASLLSNDIRYLWSTIPAVSFWCYHLTMLIAQSEQKRYAPSPKKQWANLNLSRSPKVNKISSPSKAQQISQGDKQAQADATPRTRTKRAVRNILTGVSDKYHAFEQNVAHQISQKIFTPLSPKMKSIE